MEIKSFFDNVTSTMTYVVIDEETKQCAVIDPVLDYDADSGTTDTKSADVVIDFIQKNDLSVQWILETHIHADHLTASQYIKDELKNGATGIGSKIVDVLSHWVPVFNTAEDTPLDGTQFDEMFQDGEVLKIGNLDMTVMHTPGHTPACVSYQIEDAVFVGDTLFKPQSGTARVDFPGGDAEQLYNSIQNILSLPEETRVFIGHDYPPEGQAPEYESTVAEQKKDNVMINDGIAKEDYIKIREARDKTLKVPKLLLPSLQFNLRAGKDGKPEDNGVRYIKIPINKL